MPKDGHQLQGVGQMLLPLEFADNPEMAEMQGLSVEEADMVRRRREEKRAKEQREGNKPQRLLHG